MSSEIINKSFDETLLRGVGATAAPPPPYGIGGVLKSSYSVGRLSSSHKVGRLQAREGA